MGRIIAVMLAFYVGSQIIWRLLRALSDWKKKSHIRSSEPDQGLSWNDSDIVDADYKEIP